MLKKITIIALLLILSNGWAIGYTAYRMKQPPKIDGKLDDACWRTIPMARGFTEPGSSVHAKGIASKQTGFKIGHDDKFLYLAVRCNEPEPEKIVKAENAAMDGWQDTDSIDFIYSNSYNETKTKKKIPWLMLKMGVNNAPKVLNKEMDDIPCSAKWKFTTTIDDKYWYLEAAIPFDMLALDPAKGGYFNIVRQLMTGPDSEKLTSWTVIAPKTRDSLGVCHLSRLILSDKSGILPNQKVDNHGRMVSEMDLTEWELGGYLSGWMVYEQLYPIARKGGPYSEAKAKFGDTSGWNEIEKARLNICEVFKGCIDDVERYGQKEDALYEWQRAMSKMKTVSKPFMVKLGLEHAKASLFVNGQNIKPDSDGNYRMVLLEGLNSLAIEAVATGDNPGLVFRFPEHPETDERWRYSLAPNNDWNRPGFDDRKWPLAALEKNSIWPKDARRVYFRQDLIWSQFYHSGDLAPLLPVLKEWGFSPNTTETFIHVLLNPYDFPLDTYQYVLELPQGFKLLDMKTHKRIKTNWFPEKVEEKAVVINGKPHTRYTLSFDISKQPSDEMYSAYLPIKHDGFAGDKTTFRFRRLAKGNLTELTTSVPVKMLPPVNGRDMKDILFQSYHVGSLPLSREHLKEMIKASVDMGLTSWLGQAEEAHSRGATEAHRQWLNQAILDGGAKLDMWSPAGYPLWGAQRGTKLQELRQRDPNYQARYFNDTGSKVSGWYYEFCFTYALGEGKEAFKKAMYSDYKNMLESLPAKPEYVFLNDENYPWGSLHESRQQGKHAYCFCERCKNSFKEFAELPKNLTLSDADIFANHKEQWAKFWQKNRSDRLMEMITDNLHDLEVKVIYYHNFSDRYPYELAAKHVDLCGLTIPAVQVNTRENQKTEDRLTQKAHQIGIKRYMGQSRPYFSGVVGGKARPRMYSVNGYFLQPEHLKIILVRTTATNHGGMLYEHPWQFAGGCKYYFGEATRLIHDYEKLFAWGNREDKLATADEMTYPDIMVLTNRKNDSDETERLVLLFNESDKDREITLKNHELSPGMVAEIWDREGRVEKPKTMKVRVPANDLVAIHIAKPGKSFWDWLF